MYLSIEVLYGWHPQWLNCVTVSLLFKVSEPHILISYHNKQVGCYKNSKQADIKATRDTMKV